jgi:DNA-binding Xre family transcriptional regulator
MANLTTNTLAKFSKNEPVSLEIIDRLCEVLNCQPGDIFERVEDKEEGK